MSGYSITELVKANKTQAHIEAFFTTKGKNLYAIFPSYSPQLRIRNFKPATGTVVSILGSKKSLALKRVGNDCIIDASQIHPGDITGELFVVKMGNAL